MKDQKDTYPFFMPENQEYSRVIESFPTGMFILNEDYLILEANQQGTSLIDKKISEATGIKFTEIVHNEDINNFNKNCKRAKESRNSHFFEIRLKRSGNIYFYALITIKYDIPPGADKGFYFLSLIDFTFQKMKEEVKKESEAKFENMANTAPVMIWIADVEGLFSFINKTWLGYTGKKTGEHLGMNWLKDVHPEDLEKLLETYRNAFRSKKPFTYEFRFKNKEDRFEWLIINGIPRLSQENVFMGFIGSCTNINFQKEFEEKIQKVNAELVEINNAKDKFFSIISHDLRGPLGALMNLLEIIAVENLEEEEKQQLIKGAALASKQTYALVENLLEWSRIQTGKIPFNPKKTELLHLVSKYELLYDQSLKSKNISLKTDIEEDCSVFADVNMTETVIRNLITNAIKFTKAEGTISISAGKSGSFVIVKVADTGIGIPEQDIPKLFRTDINYSTKGTAEETGTGLGLILCKELVEKQGGKISVESKKDKGTTFSFTLPAG